MATYEKDFKRLLWSYLLIIIIPMIIVGFVTVRILFAQLAADTKALNTRALEQTQALLEKHINSMLELSAQFEQSEYVKELIQDIDSGVTDNTYQLWQVKNEIGRFNTNSSIKEIGIYFKKRNEVLTSSSIYTLEEYYDYYLEKSGNEYAWWQERLKNTRIKALFAASVITDGTERTNVMVFCKPMNFTNRHSGGVAIAIVNQEDLLVNLRAVGVGESRSFAVINDDGDVVLKTDNFNEGIVSEILQKDSEEYKIGKDVILCKSFDAVSLKYIIVFRESGLSGNVNNFAFLFILLLGFGLVISVILAKLGAGRVQKPILDIVSENEKLSESMNEQIVNARAQMMSNLLYDVELNNEWTNDIIEKYGTGFSSAYYIVIAVGLPESDSITGSVVENVADATWRKIGDVMPALLGGAQLTFHAMCIGTSYVYIIGVPLEYDILEALKQIRDDFCAKTYIAINIGVGSITHDIKKISLSYEKAAAALRYGQHERPGELIHCNDIADFGNDKLYFTKEKETSLIRNINSGSVENVKKLLDELHHVNFCDRHLNYSMQKRLNIILVTSLYQVLDSGLQSNPERYDTYDRILQNLLQRKNVEEGFEIIREVCVSLCTVVNKNNDKEKIKDQILRYLDENYMNYDLSLDMLAEHLGINYYYLSRLFKEIVGNNFMTYLIDLRMRKAEQLLKKSEYSVAQVSKMIGFADSNSFIRAYKKYYHTTPGNRNKGGYT